MLLTDIQKKQFSDKHGAETDLLRFLKEHEDAAINRVELQPKPESLNSLNGFVTYDSGERYFFKTHTEENEQVSEYYNAEELARAGYPVITSKQITHKAGKQIVLYRIIDYPTLFDLLKAEEDLEVAARSAEHDKKSNRIAPEKLPGTEKHAIAPEKLTGTEKHADKLLQGQVDLDKLVAEIYEQTLALTNEEEHAKAPIHQLFWHRLNENGRKGLFYNDKSISFNGNDISFDTLAKAKWTINGVEYGDTLNVLISRSRELLKPAAALTVAGHGDAHNGNIFVDLEQVKFYMFDPAFAGRHHPLLDLTKPLFHNVFARWMYYPDQVLTEFNLNYDTSHLADGRLSIEHDFLPSKLRLQHLRSRVENVLKPTIQLLRSKNALDENWRAFVKSALFCCPFLTVNLFADYVPNGTLAQRYQLPIKLLGLCMAVELGALNHKGSSAISDIVDEVFA